MTAINFFYNRNEIGYGYDIDFFVECNDGKTYIVRIKTDNPINRIAIDEVLLKECDCKRLNSKHYKQVANNFHYIIEKIQEKVKGGIFVYHYQENDKIMVTVLVLEHNGYNPPNNVFCYEPQKAINPIEIYLLNNYNIDSNAHLIIPSDKEAEEQFIKFKDEYIHCFPGDFSINLFELLKEPSLSVRVKDLENRLQGKSDGTKLNRINAFFKKPSSNFMVLPLFLVLQLELVLSVSFLGSELQDFLNRNVIYMVKQTEVVEKAKAAAEQAKTEAAEQAKAEAKNAAEALAAAKNAKAEAKTAMETAENAKAQALTAATKAQTAAERATTADKAKTKAAVEKAEADVRTATAAATDAKTKAEAATATLEAAKTRADDAAKAAEKAQRN